MKDKAPNAFRVFDAFVDRNGRLTVAARNFVQEMWAQFAPGYPVVPVEIGGTTDDLTMTPILATAGADTYADGMIWSGTAAATSTGPVTASVGALTAVKVYKDDGAAQADAGDIVAGCFYLFCYVASLDGGNGGLVRK